MQLVIAISGPIAVGKSVFINELLKRAKGDRISTRELIQSLRQVPSERGPLQEAGDSLDRETDGQWVASTVATRARAFAPGGIVIVDSVRIPKQGEHLRIAFRESCKHVHLTASMGVLVDRFLKRKAADDPAVREFATYDKARANPTEAQIGRLASIADLVIDTSNLTPEETATIAIQRLGLADRVEKVEERN
jgi:adenylosuccinate synthase